MDYETYVQLRDDEAEHMRSWLIRHYSADVIIVKSSSLGNKIRIKNITKEIKDGIEQHQQSILKYREKNGYNFY